MKGFYIYAIINKVGDITHKKFVPIEFGEGVSVVPVRDIEVVISRIDEKISEEWIHKKLTSDAQWTEDNVKRHHGVVDALLHTAVIPFTFGTMFKTESGLKRRIEKHYSTFKELLEYVYDKQEWGVKVYIDILQYIRAIKKQDTVILEYEKKKKSVPDGMQWYLERKIDERVRDILGENIEQMLEVVKQWLNSKAVQVVYNKPSSQAMTKKSYEMFINAACFIKKSSAIFFKKQLCTFFSPLYKKGIISEITGPWPPYNFVRQ